MVEEKIKSKALLTTAGTIAGGALLIKASYNKLKNRKTIKIGGKNLIT